MGTIAKAGDGDYELPTAGAVIGRCYIVADLGTQDTSFKGTPKKAHKILLTWELAEIMADGRPFAISSRYTLSLFDQAILRQHLESWRGRSFSAEELVGFDVKNVLGAYCMLSVVHNTEGDRTYANVKGIMPVPKEMDKPPAVNKNVYYDIESGDISILPDWVQNVVKKSDEWKARGSAPTALKELAEMDSDVPF
ncbi:MAG: phage replication initiation protein, NGO0469 family [Burkholderiales bacterium]